MPAEVKTTVGRCLVNHLELGSNYGFRVFIGVRTNFISLTTFSWNCPCWKNFIFEILVLALADPIMPLLTSCRVRIYNVWTDTRVFPNSVIICYTISWSPICTNAFSLSSVGFSVTAVGRQKIKQIQKPKIINCEHINKLQKTFQR
jgi:hypothetical protein